MRIVLGLLLVVPTPGEDDRGAQRIVRGMDGSMSWTDAQYASFTWNDR